MNHGNENIYLVADASANAFNLKVLVFIAVLSVFSELLNELGLFKVQRVIMLPVVLLAMCIFLLPPAAWLFHDRVFGKKPSLLEWRGLHVCIIVSAFLGIGLLCITLSFHAVLLLVIPAMMAAQYRYQHTLSVCVMLATILLVPVSVYGSFFYGLPDRNFIKHLLTDEEAFVVANRIPLATPKRMVEIAFHYVLPRLLGVILTDVLAIGIAKRNAEMLDRQNMLAQKAREEMERRSSLQDHVIEDLAGVIETRDMGTGEHVVRTKRYVGMIARALRRQGMVQLTEEETEGLESAAPLHDVGKIAVPDAILLKPGPLTEQEFDQMKNHTIRGGEMVKGIFHNLSDRLFLDKAYHIAMYHHERWDGTGYPLGLKGTEIPLEARIMAVADVYDALVSRRVYKKPMPPERAFEVLMRESGTHFDPQVIDAVASIRDELIAAAASDAADRK